MEEDFQKRIRHEVRKIDRESEEIRKSIKRIDNMKTYDPRLIEIQKMLPNFNEKELLEFMRYVISKVHYCLRYNENDTLRRFCNEETIRKVTQQKDKYRITVNIDNVRVQYVRIDECVNEEDGFFIKVYNSVFFYDEVANNLEGDDSTDKYWNDIWIVSFKGNYSNNLDKSQVDWEIVDIEVK